MIMIIKKTWPDEIKKATSDQPFFEFINLNFKSIQGPVNWLITIF